MMWRWVGMGREMEAGAKGLVITEEIAHEESGAGDAQRPPIAREKLYSFLQARPAGADARELMGLLFKGIGSDPELGERFIRGLIGGDPNFIFDALTGLWSTRQSAALRVPLEEI